jgi:hypothetical protein
LDRYREWGTRDDLGEPPQPCELIDGEQCEYRDERLLEQHDSRVDGTEQREYGSQVLLERRDSQEDGDVIEQKEFEFTVLEQRDSKVDKLQHPTDAVSPLSIEDSQEGVCDDSPCDDDGRTSQPDRTHYDDDPEPEITENFKRSRDVVPRKSCKCTFCTFVMNQQNA